MKIFKKTLAALAIITTLLLTFSLTTFAEEPSAAEAEVEVVEEATVFGRLWEYVRTNAVTILGGLDIGMLAAYLFMYRSTNKSFANAIGKTLTGQKSAESAAEGAKVAADEVKSKIADVESRINEIEKSEIERDSIAKALLYEIMTLVQMQHTLTLNNANIPQAIKDYATTLCANCLASVTNDEKLKAAYDEMRGILGLKEGGADEEKAS